MDKHNPRIKPSYNGWPVWGWPDWDNPTKPAPIWNYCVNAQAGMSMNDSQWRVNPELVLPSPKTVMILFEEDSSDHSAFDNACELFAPTLTVDSSLGAYHIDEGNMIFFDGHVGSMRRSEFIIKCSTPNGTLELCGGYLGFTWPGF